MTNKNNKKNLAVINPNTAGIDIGSRVYWTDLSRQIFINFASLFICRL